MTLRLRNAGMLDHSLTRIDQERHETFACGEHGIVTGVDSVRDGCRVQRCREFLLASRWNDLVVGGDDHRCGHRDVVEPRSGIERTDLASRFQHVAPVVAGNLAGGPVGKSLRLALQVDLLGDPRPSLSARQFGQAGQTGETKEVEALVA